MFHICGNALTLDPGVNKARGSREGVKIYTKDTVDVTMVQVLKLRHLATKCLQTIE